MILGAHVSTANGIYNAPLNAKELGITAFQIFTKNQNRWTDKPLDSSDINKYLNNCNECGIEITVAHDSYLINLCAVEPVKLALSRKGFLEELERAEQLQINYLVMHPGSHLGAGIEAGIQAMAESFNICWEQTNSRRVKVLLETTAGQGTNLGYTFEQIGRILELVDSRLHGNDKGSGNDRQAIGVCLDTCHIFAAGYDYRSPEGYERVMADFDRIIGLDKLCAIHLNDSKKDLTSRVDRHEHIGEGFIGAEPFKYFLNDPRLKNIPALLETPGEMPDYARNLATLHSLEQ